MAFQQFGGDQKKDFPPRQMYQGDWTCADCGAKITELPFMPDTSDPKRPLRCLDCHRKWKSTQFRR